jgi:hypothetical protein
MAQESNEGATALRVVTVPSLKMPPETSVSRPPVGIVADSQPPPGLAPAVIGLDLTFPPLGGCPSTAVSPHGGAIGTADPVQLLFWGSAWQTSPLAQLANTFVAQVQSILSGPYMSGLRQYGVKRCPFGGALIVTSPNPPFAPNTFSDQNIQGVIQPLIDQGTFPEPDEPGGRNLYFVIMPPNTQYSPPPGQPPARGAHNFFSTGSGIDPDKAWYAWVGNQPLNQMNSTFCHELAEMCTNPEGDNWFINGAGSGCNEIGDLCNAVDGPLLNGVNVESYWSIFDNACLIPTAWSLRRTLAGAGKKLGGKGLRSIQDPIPSLNQFVVNL